MIYASIITTGDELLIGQVTDTNSGFIARELNAAGFAVCRRVAVGDNKKQITNALDEEKKHADIILITDGLGPTADDITKPLLCEYFGGKMVTNAFSAEVGVFHQPTTLTNKAFFKMVLIFLNFKA